MNTTATEGRCEICRESLGRNQTRACSKRCAGSISGRRRRGTGRFPYIRIRAEGRLWLLHRWVYATVIGPLGSDEVVHHRNGNKRDNRPENLEKLAAGEHARNHWSARRDGKRSDSFDREIGF